MKLPLSIVYEIVNALIEVKSLGLGIKVDYWCKRNIMLFADDYNLYREFLQDIYNRYCYKGEDSQYMSIDDEGKVIFNLKNESNKQRFYKELNDLMTMTCDEFKPYILSQEVFNNLPNVESSKFNIDLLAFLLPE